MVNRQDKKGRSKNPDGQYLRVFYSMARSPAFRRINGSALKVLFEMWMRHNGHNNGKIFLSLDSLAETLGMGKTTAMRALSELEEYGFIQKTKKGRWIRGEASEYRLTFTSDKNGPRTDEWRKWTPPAHPLKARRAWGSAKQQLPFPKQKDSSVLN